MQRGNDRDREPDLAHLPAKWIEGFAHVFHVVLELFQTPLGSSSCPGRGRFGSVAFATGCG